MWSALSSCRRSLLPSCSSSLLPCRFVTDIEYYREVDQSHLHMWEAQSTRRKFMLKLNDMDAPRPADKPCIHTSSLLHDDFDNDAVECSNYVPREPSTMLRIFANLVKRDATAPHYMFHDDPYLIPYNASQKKSFIMAKDGGRRTARYVLDRHPELFNENLIEAQPRIKAFMPKAIVDEKMEANEELLLNFIEGFSVTDATTVFEKLLDKQIKVADETLLKLLQLLCFYGDKPETNENHLMTWGLNAVVRPKWPEVADLVYSEIEKESSEARLALLCGLAKFDEKERGNKHLQVCMEKNDEFGVEGFNARIKLIDEKSFKSAEELWTSVESILKEMSKKQVRPNVDTLMSVLLVIKERHWLSVNEKRPTEHVLKDYAANVIKEFSNIKVDFGLGVFTYLSHIVPRPDCLKLVRDIEKRDWFPVKHVADFDFFPSLMKKAEATSNLQLAYAVHELYLTANNSLFLAHAMQRQVYFNILFRLMLKKEPLATTMSFYSDFSPNVWTPSNREYEELITEVASQGCYEFLPKIWSDLQLSLFDSIKKDKSLALMMSFLSVLEQDNDLNEVKRVERLQIAKEIERFVTNNPRRIEELVRLQETPTVINSAINLALEAYLVDQNDDGFNVSKKILDLCIDNVDDLLGSLSEMTMEKLLKASVRENEKKLALKCVKYAIDVMLGNAFNLAEETCESFELDQTEKETLDRLLAHDNRWKPVANAKSN